MTEEELQDSIEILSDWVESLKEAVNNKDYFEAWASMYPILYRAGEIRKLLYDKWFNEFIHNKQRRLEGEEK